VGGVVATDRVGDFLVEAGPSTILPTSGAMEQIVEAGLAGDMIAAPRGAPRYVWLNGRLRRVPWVLSPGGLIRVLGEPFVGRSPSGDDESAASFFRLRFGHEVHDRLAGPFVGGIYAGDTEQLSLAGAFPRLAELELRYGSVIVGILRGRKQAPRRFPLSSFTGGMKTLPEGLARGLDVRLGCPVRSLRGDGGSWVVETDTETFRSEALVVATPAGPAAGLLGGVSAEAGGLLRKAVYAPVAVAAAAVDDDAFPRPLAGFGFLIPRIEGLYTLGTQFNSCLFGGRAPRGRQLLTSFIGGASLPEIVDWTEERIWSVVSGEVGQVLSLPAGSMTPLALHRYERAIPQYRRGHPAWRSAVAQTLGRQEGLFLAGNYLEGVSLPAAMENGMKVAQRAEAFIRRKR
jgi:oxygen-dependent protoporphyrinogen oxidase